MDRRLFLTGMFGIAGAAALASVVRPINATAGVPGARSGILDELDAPAAGVSEGEDTQAEVQPIQYRRRRRRRVWRRVCRRYWRYGRVRTRCYRRRVWVWY